MTPQPNAKCGAVRWNTRQLQLAEMALDGELTSEQLMSRTGKSSCAIIAKLKELRRARAQREEKAARLARKKKRPTLAEIFAKK